MSRILFEKQRSSPISGYSGRAIFRITCWLKFVLGILFQFLIEQKVAEWSELPLWIANEDGKHGGFDAINVQKAINDGLTFRPIGDTVRDTLTFLATRPADYTFRAGLTREKEADVLAAWHKSKEG